MCIRDSPKDSLLHLSNLGLAAGEMIDETGQVSEKLKEQTLELLDFAAQRLGKEDKEMAVTFVTNERSLSLIHIL